MMQTLIKHISNHAPCALNIDETDIIISFFEIKTNKKKHFFIPGGESNLYFRFINYGAAFQNSTIEKCANHVSKPALYAWLVRYIDRFTFIKPFTYYIQAEADTKQCWRPSTDEQTDNAFTDICFLAEFPRKGEAFC